MSLTATLSNSIILQPYSKDYAESLREATTYHVIDEYLSKISGTTKGKIVKNYQFLYGGKMSIPIGRLNLIDTQLYKINDVRTLNPVKLPDPKVQLRESQESVCNAVEDNCMINAPVGWGKTFTALHIVKKLGQKALIITHTTILRDQWAGEVRKLFGIEPGVIGGGKIINIESPIIVSNTQTLVKVIKDMRNLFGTVIVDECHHVPASTFSNIVSGLTARYKIGLSGTLKRVDKLEVTFPDYFSDTIYRPEIENVMIPSVYLVNSGLYIPAGDTWQDRVTNLCSTPEYSKFILKLATTMGSRGYKVLVVGDRVNFLENLYDRSKDISVYVTSDIVGQDRVDALQKIKSGEVNILYGTRSIFSEGVSIDELSCLILASPVANNINLTQLIGRIQRTVEGKKNPVVIDPQLSDPSSKRQSRNRMHHYSNMGYKVYLIEKF